MSKVFLAEKSIKIKLIGDSITHGMGGSGFAQNGEPIVGDYSRNKDGFCWARLFGEYMKERFGCAVVNNACSGTAIEFVIGNFGTLVEDDDDIVICAIGTNNRHQNKTDAPKKTKSEYMERFYQNIIKLYEKFREAEKDVIFVANIPASEENEKDGETFWRIFHMEDVNALYEKAAEENGFPFISLYSRFVEYCGKEKISVGSLLADGLHPNDEGHRVILDLMLDALGLKARDR